MMRSLYSGVSGLKVHQTKMDVIGNNISNVNTVGFRGSTVNRCILSDNTECIWSERSNRHSRNERGADWSWF
jgi:flagellar hook protein FlgE